VIVASAQPAAITAATYSGGCWLCCHPHLSAPHGYHLLLPSIYSPFTFLFFQPSLLSVGGSSKHKSAATGGWWPNWQLLGASSTACVVSSFHSIGVAVVATTPHVPTNFSASSFTSTLLLVALHHELSQRAPARPLLLSPDP
jgi:hypothetical protein